MVAGRRAVQRRNDEGLLTLSRLPCEDHLALSCEGQMAQRVEGRVALCSEFVQAVCGMQQEEGKAGAHGRVLYGDR